MVIWLNRSALADRRLLAMTVQQIEELRLQGGARPVGVEVGEKRVLGFLQHDGGIETRAEAFGECGFACADRSLRSRCGGTARRTMISSRQGLDSTEDAAQDDRDRVRTGRSGVRERAARRRPPPFPRSNRRWRRSSGWRISACFAIPLPPAAPCRRRLRDAASEAPAVVPPPPPPDLVRLLSDSRGARPAARGARGRTRRPARRHRAAGSRCSSDPDPEVRYMAAFALGLIGDKGSGGPARRRRSATRRRIVQGGAAEALGLIGDAICRRRGGTARLADRAVGGARRPCLATMPMRGGTCRRRRSAWLSTRSSG